MKKKLKVLVLSDGTRPTTIDQDLSKEMKTAEWKTEANVMAALEKLGHAAEHLALFDDLDVLRQKLEAFQPDVLFNLVEQFNNNPRSIRILSRSSRCRAFHLPAAAPPA